MAEKIAEKSRLKDEKSSLERVEKAVRDLG